MLKQEEIQLEDTNLANYDSPEAKQARHDAAKSEEMYKGVGERAGLMIWRVENLRTETDLPNFGINRWPESTYGQFFTGDSYVVLNSYYDGRKLLHDVHFWLGKESSQDELGVAAYKAVEVDDLLKGTPVQHRETQGCESQLFKSYFKNGIIYLEGGIASGFRPAKPNEYKHRLFHIKSDAKKHVSAFEVPVNVTSLNQGDVFILDLGQIIYNFAGDCADPFEKLKGSVLASNLRLSRGGSVKVTDQLDDAFWKAVGGTKNDVVLTMTTPANAPVLTSSQQEVEIDNIALFRLTDESGTLKFLKVHQGRVYPSMLRAKDVFILDSGPEIFIWIGMESSKQEQDQAMSHAMMYLKNQGKSTSLPITRVIQGETNKAFDEIVFSGKIRKGWLARSLGAPEHDPTFEVLEVALGAFGEVFQACSGERDIAHQIEREWNVVDRAVIERDLAASRPLDIRL